MPNAKNPPHTGLHALLYIEADALLPLVGMADAHRPHRRLLSSIFPCCFKAFLPLFVPWKLGNGTERSSGGSLSDRALNVLL